MTREIHEGMGWDGTGCRGGWLFENDETVRRRKKTRDDEERRRRRRRKIKTQKINSKAKDDEEERFKNNRCGVMCISFKRQSDSDVGIQGG